SLAAIDNTLYDAFGQRQVSVMYSGMNQYHVVMEVDPKYAVSPASLSSVYVHSSGGRDVPLSAFASFGIDQTPLSLPHQGQFPAVTISFNLAPGFSLRSEEHTSELQSPDHLVCRLLLEKKNKH